HGVNKAVMHQIQLVDAARLKRIQHNLDRTDQLAGGGLVTQVRQRSHYITAVVAEEVDGLLANGADFNLHAFAFPVPHLEHDALQQVDVQATTQTAIRGHHDITDALDFAFLQKDVAVFRISSRSVTDHIANTFRVGSADCHAILSLTHLTGGDHFHRAGNFLRALDATNLGTYLFSDGHLTFAP